MKFIYSILKTAGIVLMILGIIGTLVYGARALENSESLNILGLQIAVSSADWTPVIVSGLILLAGIVVTALFSRSRR